MRNGIQHPVLTRRFWVRAIPVLACTLAGAWVAVASWPNAQADRPWKAPLAALGRLEYDTWFALRGAQPGVVDSSIAVVGFDSQTESRLGQTWPPDRAVFAKAIRALRRDGAKVIALDVLLEDASAAEADRALDEALGFDDVVLATRLDRDPNPRAMRKALVPPFADEAKRIDFERNALIGVAEVPVDEDGVVRRFLPVVSLLGEWTPSFATAVVLRSQGLTETDLTVGSGRLSVGRRSVPFTGPSSVDPVDGSLLPSAQVDFPGGWSAFPTGPDLAEVAAGEFAPGTFRGKLVLLGITGTQLVKELGDGRTIAATSRAPERIGGAVRRDLPGVVVQAHYVNALLRDRWLRPLPSAGRWFVGGLITLLAVLLSRRIADWRGVLALGALLAVANGGAYLAFVQGSTIVPMAGVSIFAGASSLALAWADRSRLRKRWAGYVSPSVFKLIAESDEAVLRTRCRATVLFVDIRGFTAIADMRPPEDVVDLLNQHFARMIPAIMAEQGTIDKFLGDGLLAVFGAPVPMEEVEMRAAQASLGILEACREPVYDRGGEAYQFQVGIGLATGDLVAGQVGGRQRHDFTVIGDVVNRAARLQSESTDGTIWVDAPTAAGLVGFDLEAMGERQLKGISEPVACVRVVGRAPIC